MHDISVIHRQHLEVAAARNADHLLRFAEMAERVLDADSPLGIEAKAVLDRIRGPVLENLNRPFVTGPHTYEPISDRVEDGLRATA